MPKPKPDNIVRHEIVLGRAERELLDTATTAYTANRVITPFTSLLSSTSGLLLLSGLALAYLERYLPEDWADRTTEQMNDWFETENLIAGGIFATGGGILGALIGGPFWAVTGAAGATAGGIYGGFVQESAEEAQAAGVPKLLSYNQFFQIYGAARMLKGIIDEASA
tara:strand:+ start:47 stop:547 length:501 start_codon:yes stop_codon:yes gene_type:complete